MKLNANTQIIIGPPGTGKTATLIKMAQDLILQGVDPTQIGYISFTRQAIKEARDRIMAATGSPVESFIGFRTLHAMAFWLLGKSTTDITSSHEVMSVAFLPKHLQSPQARERTKVYAQLYGFYRIQGGSLSKIWGNYAGKNAGTEEDWLEWIVLYNAHKKAQGKIDFADLIQEFIDRDIKFPFQYLFIDEAQDFAADQWAAVQILAKVADKVIVAGDSDQAVYGWAGAKSVLFDELQGERTILSESFRVPFFPHLFASRILERMGREIQYRPTGQAGKFHWINDREINNLPFANGETWFILCRNNCHTARMEKLLFDKGIWWGRVSQDYKWSAIEKMMQRIQWYKDALQNKGSERRFILLLKEGTRVREAIEQGQPWYVAFDTWSVDQVEYLRLTEGQWDSPKVFLGTFHASKGAEADNVIVYGDCTRRIAEAYEQDAPEELRALYVAVTRTRNNLYIVQKTGTYGIPWHRFQKLPEDLTNGLL